MGGLSIWHWLILLVVVMLIFGGGKGKISSMMGDFGKGIKSFKQSMAEDDKPVAQDASMTGHDALHAPLPDQNKTTINQG